jgi:glutathione S-transferase
MSASRPFIRWRDLGKRQEARELLAPVYGWFSNRFARPKNANPLFQNRFRQFPEYGETQRAVVYQRLERMDQELDEHQFVAADRFTIAQITALVAIDFAGRLAHISLQSWLHLTRWHAMVSERASAKA